MSLGIWHKGSKNIRSILVGCAYISWGAGACVAFKGHLCFYDWHRVMGVPFFIFCYSDAAHRLILVYYISGTHYVPF